MRPGAGCWVLDAVCTQMVPLLGGVSFANRSLGEGLGWVFKWRRAQGSELRAQGLERRAQGAGCTRMVPLLGGVRGGFTGHRAQGTERRAQRY
jgi:hypothetical protein